MRGDCYEVCGEISPRGVAKQGATASTVLLRQGHIFPAFESSLTRTLGMEVDRSATAGSTAAANIDCAVEMQIAVVSGLKPDDNISDGEWHLAATGILPVRSSGGPGHVVSNTNGVVIELQWDDVRMTHDGKRIKFDGGKWRIMNRIDRRDGVSQTVEGGPSRPALNIGMEFEWLASCEIDTMFTERAGRRLVIRARVLPETPSAPPLKLEERAGLGA